MPFSVKKIDRTVTKVVLKHHYYRSVELANYNRTVTKVVLKPGIPWGAGWYVEIEQ